MLKKAFLSLLLGAGSGLPISAYTPVGDDYLCDFPAELNRYRYGRWFAEEMPIKVYIPAPPAEAKQSGALMAIVKQAFAAWQEQAPQLCFVFVEQAALANLQIKWHTHFPDSESSWGPNLYPQSYLSEGKVRHRAVVHLALRGQAGDSTVSGPTPVFTAAELQALATHAVGHALGLPHSKDPDDLMTPYLFRLTANPQAAITSRDLATLQRLYGLPHALQISPCNG